MAHRYHGAAVSCGFERRSRLKAISAGARRENGGVVGHTDKVKSKETAGARRERERQCLTKVVGGGGACSRQIEHPRRDNIITGRMLWGVRARRYDMRAMLRRSTQRGPDSHRARFGIAGIKERKRKREPLVR